MTTGRTPPPRRWGATLVGTAGILLWASETALARFTAGLPPFEIVALAFAAAACLSPLAWWATGESPGLALRQPPRVWLLTVPSLVAYHACVYAALRWAPAAPAALLQGCTPLVIVLGSALMPGGRLRWWHVVGLIAGLEGLTGLVLDGGGAQPLGSSLNLALIGAAAGLWGAYSLAVSRLGSVPTSAMGPFYAASAALALALHAGCEDWVTPDPAQGAAVAALGVLPMGLALFCWDYGLKRGDVRALGVASYVEPLVGAGLVVALGQGDLRWPLLASSFVILGGAVIGAADGFAEEGAQAAPDDAGLPAAGTRNAATLTLRLPEGVLARIGAAAEREGRSVADVARRLLERGAEAALADGMRPAMPSRGDAPKPCFAVRDGRLVRVPVDGGVPRPPPPRDGEAPSAEARLSARVRGGAAPMAA